MHAYTHGHMYMRMHTCTHAYTDVRDKSRLFDVRVGITLFRMCNFVTARRRRNMRRGRGAITKLHIPNNVMATRCLNKLLLRC